MGATCPATTIRHLPFGRRLAQLGIIVFLMGAIPWIFGLTERVDPIPFAAAVFLGTCLVIGGGLSGMCTRLEINAGTRSLIMRGPSSWDQGDWREWLRPRVVRLDDIRQVQSIEYSPVGASHRSVEVERYLLVWTQAPVPWVAAEGLSQEDMRQIGEEVARLSGARYVERIQVGD